MLHLLQTTQSYEPVGSTVYHYGYKCEVRANKEVWAEIPDNLLSVELAAGRVKIPVTIHNVAPVAEAPKAPEPVAEPEVVVEQPAVVEDTVKVEVTPVKIDGRSKAAKQNR